MRARTAFGGFVAAALALLMAGCTLPGPADDLAENQPPEARLTAEEKRGWTEEPFTFDATESEDPDGNITAWRFDFGDGTPPIEVQQEDEARIEHEYRDGGEYTVTVTVFDEGAESEGSLSDSAVETVAVNERIDVVMGPLYATMVPPSNNSTATNESYEFNVTEDADRYDLDFEIHNSMPAGDSRVVVRMLDASQNIVEEETVTVSGTSAEETVHFEGLLEAASAGNWTIVMEVQTGGAAGEGDLEIYYDEGFTGGKEDDESPTPTG